jgi:hypothetical protein
LERNAQCPQGVLVAGIFRDGESRMPGYTYGSGLNDGAAMMLSKEQIKTAAMQLDPVDREALAEELLLSIEDGEREAIDIAWLAEARRRDAAFLAGGTRASSVDQAIDRVKDRAQP